MSDLCLNLHVLDALDFRDLHIASQVSWSWYTFFGSDAAKKRVLRKHGVPRKWRFRFWQFQSRAFQLSRVGGGLATYEEYLERSSTRMGSKVSWFSLSQQPGVEGEIARDVTRTFPDRILFRVKTGLGRQMLFNVLVALAMYEPRVGYCQGMNFVAGVLIVVALGFETQRNPTEELALATNGLSPEKQKRFESHVFWIMVSFLQHFHMHELWRPGVPQLKLRIFQFEKLVSSKLPKLHAHFDSIGLAPDFFASQWFLTLMSYNMDIEQLVRVWDVFMLDGWKTIFKTGIAILSGAKEQIVHMNLEQMTQFFRSSEATSKRDKITLNNAFQVKVSTRELDQLESKYISQELLGGVDRPQEDSSTYNPISPPTSLASGASSEIDNNIASGRKEDGRFLDRRMAIKVFKEELLHLDSDTRQDVQYLLARVEDAERQHRARESDFISQTADYAAIEATLEELLRSKKVASDQLLECTRGHPGSVVHYQSLVDKIEAIDLRVCSVSQQVQLARSRTCQSQVEMEEIMEKKVARSSQLRAVLERSEHVKSQALKSLWTQLLPE